MVACRRSVIHVFKEAGFATDVIYEELDREEYVRDYRAFRRYLDELNKYDADTLLHVRASYISEDVFIHAVRARQKICVRTKDVDGENSIQGKFFVNHTYNKIIDADESEDQLTHYGLILKNYGMPQYQSKVFELRRRPVPFGLERGKYILLCPGASKQRKAWPAGKFAEVASQLPDPIVLCGDTNDIEAGKSIEESVPNAINLIGKSNLEEWYALIQNARLVIANESGAVHVAAASKVRCVCIGAQEFGESFLPYRPEYVREDDCLPLVVRCAPLSCFYCKGRRRHIDSTGGLCYKATGTFPCLEDIETEQVLQAVNSIL